MTDRGFRAPGAWIDEMHAVEATYPSPPPIFVDGDFLRTEYQNEMLDVVKRVGEMFNNGLEEATEKLILAHFEARGYTIVKPSAIGGREDVIRDQARQIARLQATVAMLRGGGSIPPAATT